MVGPVLYLDMLLASRRGRSYIFRWIYAAWLVLQIMYLFFTYMTRNLFLRDVADPVATVGGWFVEVFVIQQLIFLVLITPTFVAGAITDEKSRGTLQYLLTTDLTSWQIVVGKLIGRSAQVLLLLLTGLPPLCFLGALGGVSPLTLTAATVALIPPLLAVAGATLLASVWCRQTRDAVLAVYLIGVIIYIAVRSFRGPLQLLDPLYVLTPVWGDVSPEALQLFVMRFFASAGIWLAVAFACALIASWRLRPAYIGQMIGSEKKRRDRWWRARRRAVYDEPIRWKERHVEGLSPISLLRRIPTWLAISVVLVLTTFGSVSILLTHMTRMVTLAELFTYLQTFDLSAISGLLLPSVYEGFVAQSIIAMLLASLVVGIRCSGAVSGERERQTWEALLLSPLTARQIIGGKLWGIIGASYPYVLAYAAPALLFGLVAGLESFFWVLLWLGVTWLAMYFVGAAGIYCSVRSRNSWRSLLGTMAIGYVGGTLVFLLTTPITFFLALMFALLLAFLGSLLNVQIGPTPNAFVYYWQGFLIAVCLVLALSFWGLAYFFVSDSQRWVAQRERTRHWHDVPRRRSRPKRKKAGPRYYR